MTASLRVVAPNPTVEPARPAPSAGVGDRVRQLQAEAKRLAGEHVEALQKALLQTEQLAEEIARGGDVYPAGVRDVARRLAEDAVARATTIASIMGRIDVPVRNNRG